MRKFDAPSAFVFPFSYVFNASNTSFGETPYSTTTTIPFINITLSNTSNYYKNSAPEFTQVGVGMYVNSYPAPIKYTKADAIYQFPDSFGKRDTCDSKYGMHIPGIGYYGQFIHRVNFTDGWGTLITPYGTFQSLRIKSTLAIRDTIADTSGIGFSILRPLQYEYKWLVQGGKIPYLQVNARNIGGNIMVNSIMYRDSIRYGIAQLGTKEYTSLNFNFQVFPNPASNYIVLDYFLDENENVNIKLFDISGKEVCDLLNKKQNVGAHVEVLNLSPYNMQTGIYFVKVQAGKREGSCKIITQ